MKKMNFTKYLIPFLPLILFTSICSFILFLFMANESIIAFICSLEKLNALLKLI